jgi:asparagine synthase (glutamine-hydrolysing)
VQGAEDGASAAEDAEGRVRALVVGCFDERERVVEELTRAGFEVGPSDAELAVAAYRAWGSQFLSQLSGRFALAVYDATSHALILARDALGHWPVYYRAGRHEVAFATRLQVLLEAGLAPRALDVDGAASYYRLGFVPSPRTAVQDVGALPPGAALVARDGRLGTLHHHACDFSVQDEASSLDDQLGRAEARLEARLREDEEAAEVWLEPDLATVVLVALQGRVQGRTVDTVSPDDDERAARVAHLLGTRHRTVEVRPDLDALVRVVGALDQPFADPAWWVRDAMGRTGRQPTASALGAGPVFAANPRYPDALTLDAVRRSLPDWATSMTPDRSRMIEAVIRTPGWPRTMPGLNDDFAATVRRLRGPGLDADLDPLAALQAADLRYGTSDAHLVGLNAWSAWSTVRVRTPYLDGRLLDIGCRLPSRGRLEGREVGAGLRRIARRMLPGRLAREDFAPHRPDVGAWLRGGLREAAEMAFFGTPGGLSGLLDASRLRRTWYAHQLGWADHGPWLFALLVFELWAQSTLTSRV